VVVTVRLWSMVKYGNSGDAVKGAAFSSVVAVSNPLA